MQSSLTIIQHHSFFHFFKISLRGIWNIKAVRIIIIIFGIFSLLSWVMTCLASGFLDLYSLLFNLLTIASLAGMYVFLALMSVLITMFQKPHLFRPLTYVFDHWGIHVEGDGYKASLPWRQISKAEEKHDAFVLFEANMPSFTVDKQNLHTDEQIEFFRSLTGERVA